MSKLSYLVSLPRRDFGSLKRCPHLFGDFNYQIDVSYHWDIKTIIDYVRRHRILYKVSRYNNTEGVVMKLIQLMQCNGPMNIFMQHAFLEGYKISLTAFCFHQKICVCRTKDFVGAIE